VRWPDGSNFGGAFKVCVAGRSDVAGVLGELVRGQQVAGRPITVGWMKGRSRAFRVGGAQAAGPSALSVGFNDRCDAIVATAVLGREQTAAIEPAVMEFLNSKTVLQWVGVTLGL